MTRGHLIDSCLMNKTCKTWTFNHKMFLHLQKLNKLRYSLNTMASDVMGAIVNEVVPRLKLS